ncbi:hypothetical protein ILYODFUR_037158 [Ilyodon furcidens]|uniref:Uncharacterized protein n=1 Tax=Ilyodon furcidens TaxID=33524 RepID=A0ABV0UR97_9TELE
MSPPLLNATAASDVIHTGTSRLQTQQSQALFLISGDSHHLHPLCYLLHQRQYNPGLIVCQHKGGIQLITSTFLWGAQITAWFISSQGISPCTQRTSCVMDSEEMV